MLKIDGKLMSLRIMNWSEDGEEGNGLEKKDFLLILTGLFAVLAFWKGQDLFAVLFLFLMVVIYE